jgi:hypothetical protein
LTISSNPLRDPRTAAPAHRGAVRPGDLRRHRRPVPQEADARRLRPGQPRPAAAGLRSSASPAATGRRGLRAGRPRRGQGARPHPVPRGGLAAARRGHSASSPASSTTTRRSSGCAETIDELDEARGTGGNFAFYLSVPPRSSRWSQQLKKHGLADHEKTGLAPRGHREAVRPRPEERPRSSTRSSTRSSPQDRSSASTTTSARRRSRTSWRCASPTRCSSRSGTGPTSTTCRSPWPRTSASAAGPATTTASAPPATSSRTTCSSCSR